MKKALAKQALVWMVAGWLLLSAGAARAQEDRSPKRGFQSPGSYALSDLESISTTNGNMIVRLPLASLPAGRGGNPGHALYLIYNSKLWNSRKWTGTNGYTIDGHPITFTSEELVQSGSGWSYGYEYQLELINRASLEDAQPCTGTSEDAKNSYIWKLSMTFPDGSVHEFRPSGYSDYFDDGYFQVNPNGYAYNGCNGTLSLVNSSGMSYYSTDGSFMRLEIEHTPGSNNDGSANAWTLYMPNGTKVTNALVNSVNEQRIYDRNDNYVEIKNRTITDQLGRSISLELGAPGTTDIIRTKGFGGAELITQVVHRENWVHKTYTATTDHNAPEFEKEKTFSRNLGGVAQVILPSQAGSLSYTFDYNGKAAVPAFWGDYSTGWGELRAITLPSGAKAAYTFSLDSDLNLKPRASMVLKRYPTQKVLTHREEYDLTGAPVNTPCEPDTQGCITERWSYDIGETSSSVTGPDGGVVTQFFENTQLDFPESGLGYKTVRADGGVSEQVWEKNLPHQNETKSYNWYVRTEFNSIANALGTPVKTVIKDYDYDKNGNVTAVYEYDWINYADIPRNSTSQRINLARDGSGRIAGIPGLTLKRGTRNTYYNQAPPASSSPGCMNVPASSGCQNIYVFKNLNRRLINLIESSEVGDGTQTLARAEFSYDNTEARGNLTEQRGWDSVKAPALPASLTASNAVILSRAFDQFGNAVMATDANGIQTELTFGNIQGPNGLVSGLYPTQSKVAVGRPEQVTSSQEFDFYTGVLTKAVDEGNNIQTSSHCDVFGRPKLVIAAEGKPEETRVRTIYNDVERRVIVKADLKETGDEKLVKIQHYDQLGRVRLTRQLENYAPNDETNETIGVKVQTRYSTSGANSYLLVSNPYRAAFSSVAGSEPTMGWTRTKMDRSGRIVEAETFAGGSLPAPWSNAGNTISTGVVVTAYDASYTTVTDQAGRSRRSVTDALGRLIRIDESDASGSLGSVDAPVQSTGYAYDALGNLKQVLQAAQTRTFNYSSLSRLISATNPESGAVQYSYDANGNLVLKIDPRTRPGNATLSNCSIPYTGNHIATCYEYDSLNRIKTRTYNDGTPNVVYTYDTLTNGKGRLASVSSSVSTTSYSGYDSLGRIVGSTQVTDGHTYVMPEYKYDLANNLISQTYPSGRVVATNFDDAGRLSSITGQKSGEAAKTYADSFSYAAHGAITSLKLGNNLWEHTSFNTRLQPTQIGLGTGSANSSLLQLDYSYGTTDNNGNVRSQVITLPGLSLTQNYAYDQLNRLKSFTETGGLSQTFDYDRYGNRAITAGYVQQQSITPAPQSVSAFNPTNNRITNETFDAAGNLQSAASGHLLGYDAENKMTSHDDAQTVGVVDHQYFYDGEGRRVKKITGNVSTIYVYNALGQLVAEYTDNSPSQSNGTLYYTSDQLGTPRVISNNQGAITSRHDYMPFGEEISAIDGRSVQQGYVVDNVKQKFTGKERDDETGLDYFNVRYYSSSQGRFTSIDPFMGSGMAGKPQSWNRYVYSYNNPLRFTDPTGMMPGDFYNEEGNKIGTDGKNDGKIYLVTKSGSKLEMPDYDARQEIGVDAVNRSNKPSPIAGDKGGGLHEEGGIVVETANGQLAVPSVPGPYQEPTTNKPAEINVLNSADPNLAAQATSPTLETTYHIHSAGVVKSPANDNQPIGTTVWGPGKARSGRGFAQDPSGTSANPGNDLNFAANTPTRLGYHIVVGARDKTVYFYNGSGVIGTLPLDKFVKIK